MSAAAAPPVGRLAPSPTGRLHVGHARTFLIAWWAARSRGGRVLLRIEDLDEGRVREETVALQLRDLEWLGLDWDGAPLRQSEDLEPYRAAIASLERAGRLYPCVCTRREIHEAQSAPQAGVRETRYPGTCRGRFADERSARRATAREPGLRFRVAPGAVEVVDALHGPLAFDVDGAVGDFLVGRRDGGIAYQLAVVVDDARQGVTQVVRSDDLLASTARQALLQDALGFARPAWAHVPLVLDAGGERMAKRRESETLAGLRAAGVDPRAIVGWVARSVGLAAEERARPEELLASFRLERVPRDAVRFDDGARRALGGGRVRG